MWIYVILNCPSFRGATNGDFIHWNSPKTADSKAQEERHENGKWKMENGKWKMENGKWKMENKLEKFGKIENPLLEKTYALSLTAVGLYKEILLSREYVLSRQFLRCSTSPGAMAEEAQGAHSKKDFIAKLEIGLKEVKESKYWLRLLMDSQFVTSSRCSEVQKLQNEVEALLTAIIISAKRGL